MSRCVIIGAAEIKNTEFVKSYLCADDIIVCCDGGLARAEQLGVTPQLIVGDFDSHENPHLPVETIVLPCEKDDTDTLYAVKAMLQRGYDDFLLIGVVGGRLDHTLGNLSILQMLYEHGAKGMIVDDYSEMRIVGAESAEITGDCRYFSLLNLCGMTRGVTIENAKYPLQAAEILSTYQYGISNEVLPGKTARVRVADGSALLIKIYQE